MEKFKDLIFKLAETHPNTPLKPAARTLLQERLNHFVSQYETPDHPPYSEMIDMALRELNEKKGSSEKSISQFLRKEYDDGLPLAHSVLLKHHLVKLCESGDIIVARGKKYMLAGERSTKLNKKHGRKCGLDLVMKRDQRCRKKRSQNLIENGVNSECKYEIERFISNEDGENGVRGVGPSGFKMDIVHALGAQAQQRMEQYGYGRPDVSTSQRPPVVVEQIEFENPTHFDSAVERITESKRAVRQQRRWSRWLSGIEQLAFTSGEQKVPNDLKMCARKRQSEALEIHMLDTAEPLMIVDDKVEGIKIRGRRRRKLSRQTEITVIDEPSAEMESGRSPPTHDHHELPLKEDGQNKEFSHQALPNEENNFQREQLCTEKRVPDVNIDANYTSFSKNISHCYGYWYRYGG